MAKSYKKNPITKDGRTGKTGKILANKKVRRYRNCIPNGKSYRKIYNSWEIHDYVFRETYSEHKKSFESDLKAYLNGGSNIDPRDKSKYFNKWYEDNYWESFYKRK